ncbi:MAG: molecular chaperone TorD family protein, partial [Magnetococcales bacterium]|nr:molecular chaperone TorD family protein [Magnetococcales bacterium]
MMHAPVSEEDVLRELIERAAIFRLLARCFAYPHAGHRAEMAAALQQASGHAGLEGVEWHALTAEWESAEEEELEREYVRLFMGGAPCSLHETAYGDGRRMAGKPHELSDIRGFYKAFGLTLSESEPNLPDHLATELEFYSLLLLKQAYAIEEGWQEQREITEDAARKFMEHHLGRWVGAFAAALLEHNGEAAYRTLGAVVVAVVATECERLGVQPEFLIGRLSGDIMQEDTLICPRDEEVQVP